MTFDENKRLITIDLSMITDKIISNNNGVVTLKGVLTDSNLAPKSTNFTMIISLIKIVDHAANTTLNTS